MEEKRRRGEDKVDISHDVMERIGQQADPSTQARLGVAMGTQGASLRLGARQRADKATTVLQSVVRKHPIVNTPDDPMNNSGFGVGKVARFRKQLERKRRETEPGYWERHAVSLGFSFGFDPFKK
jgi:hypothetical protein